MRADIEPIAARHLLESKRKRSFDAIKYAAAPLVRKGAVRALVRTQQARRDPETIRTRAAIVVVVDAAQQVNDIADEPVTISQVGDFDPAVVLINVSLEWEMRQHPRSDVDLDFRRIGTTEEQVIELDSPTNTRKTGDKLSRHVKFTVEAEAMQAPLMRTLDRTCVESVPPAHALRQALLIVVEERECLEVLAAAQEPRGGA